MKVKLLKDLLSKVPALNTSMLHIKVATVDGFQGSECDIIILSCVRSHLRFARGKFDLARRRTPYIQKLLLTTDSFVQLRKLVKVGAVLASWMTIVE